MKKRLTILSLLICLLLLLASCGEPESPDNPGATDSAEVTTDAGTHPVTGNDPSGGKTPGEESTGSGHLNNGGANTEAGWGYLHPVQ